MDLGASTDILVLRHGYLPGEQKAALRGKFEAENCEPAPVHHKHIIFAVKLSRMTPGSMRGVRFDKAAELKSLRAEWRREIS